MNIRDKTPTPLDGIAFSLVLALAAFLGRGNPHFRYPDILWCFLFFLLFNLINFSFLAKRMDLSRRMLLSVTCNTVFVTLAVYASGGRFSYLWVMYLLPVFHSALVFEKKGVIATTGTIVFLMALFQLEPLLKGDWAAAFEGLIKIATISMSAAVVLRTALGERAADMRLLEEQEKIAREREKTRTSLQHMDRLATLGTLTASVAHEIKSPLSTILGYSQLPLESEMSKEILQDILPRIERNAQRCVAIIQNMLRFSRKEKSAQVPSDLNALIHQCVELKKHDWVTQRLTVAESYCSDLPRISISPVEFQQVVLNLLTNAQQAMSATDTSQPRITIKTEYDASRMRVTINDNGPGIPPEILEKIWEPFFTTKGEKLGTGLGLSISKRIIETQGGELNVSSKVGEGAGFTVQFPLSPALAGEEALQIVP